MDALLASQPRDPAVRGGFQASGPVGVEQVTPRAAFALSGVLEDQPIDPFTGKGVLLESDDRATFKAIDELWRTQDQLGDSRVAQDTHWTAIKQGYAFSTLYKVPNADIYQQQFPPGKMTRSAVPNKQADLCSKLTETLMVDAARPDPQAETDDEASQRAAEMAREFLEQDGGEDGTDDVSVFYYLVDGATTKASTFAHLFVDPVGGGSVPKQIKAHPQATDPANPLDAIDPLTGQPVPTTDYVLRYVTPADEMGQAQFTPNPSEAERVWLPRIRVQTLDRRHVRLFPETANVHDARAAIVACYTTVGEAKTWWPETVGQMDDAQLDALCDWLPPKGVTLLPAVIRSAWKKGRKGKDALVGDARILFYYACYHIATPDHPDGAAVYVNGALQGTVLHRDTLAAVVEMPSGAAQDETVTDLRVLDIPLVQLTLVQDPEDGDPTGKAVMARIGGAGEAGATLATSLLEAIDKILHPARFAIATSPLSDDDIEESRGTGKLATILSADDRPIYEEPPQLPGDVLGVVDWNYEQMDSAIGLNKPAQGSDDAKEVSGVARRIAVNQALIAVSRMQHGVNVAWQRYWRLKLQLAMKWFTVPQLLRYVGPDGAAKQEWFSGVDFARVGQVTIKPGTGTLMPPNEKVNYVLQLQSVGYVDGDEAADVARPAFAQVLGVPENPHVQRIERQVSSWLEGPPEGWVEATQAYQQAVAVHAQQAQMTLQMDPMAQVPPPPPAPWTPFAELPMDREPAIAAIRKRRLARLMAKVEFSSQPPEWQQVVITAYETAVAAMQQSVQNQPQLQAMQQLDAGASQDATAMAAG